MIKKWYILVLSLLINSSCSLQAMEGTMLDVMSTIFNTIKLKDLSQPEPLYIKGIRVGMGVLSAYIGLCFLLDEGISNTVLSSALIGTGAQLVCNSKMSYVDGDASYAIGYRTSIGALGASLFCKKTKDTNELCTLRKLLVGGLLGVGMGESLAALYNKNGKEGLIAGGLLALAALFTTQKDIMQIAGKQKGHSLNPAILVKNDIRKRATQRTIAISSDLFESVKKARYLELPWCMRGIHWLINKLHNQDDEEPLIRRHQQKEITELELVTKVLPYVRTLQAPEESSEVETEGVFISDPKERFALSSELARGYLSYSRYVQLHH